MSLNVVITLPPQPPQEDQQEQENQHEEEMADAEQEQDDDSHSADSDTDNESDSDEEHVSSHGYYYRDCNVANIAYNIRMIWILIMIIFMQCLVVVQCGMDLMLHKDILSLIHHQLLLLVMILQVMNLHYPSFYLTSSLIFQVDTVMEENEEQLEIDRRRHMLSAIEQRSSSANQTTKTATTVGKERYAKALKDITTTSVALFLNQHTTNTTRYLKKLNYVSSELAESLMAYLIKNGKLNVSTFKKLADHW